MVLVCCRSMLGTGPLDALLARRAGDGLTRSSLLNHRRAFFVSSRSVALQGREMTSPRAILFDFHDSLGMLRARRGGTSVPSSEDGAGGGGGDSAGRARDAAGSAAGGEGMSSFHRYLSESERCVRVCVVWLQQRVRPLDFIFVACMRPFPSRLSPALLFDDPFSAPQVRTPERCGLCRKRRRRQRWRRIPRLLLLLLRRCRIRGRVRAGAADARSRVER
jgi:hypothetical protein